MKYFLSILLLLSLPAQAANVIFSYTNFNNTTIAANTVIRILPGSTPLQDGNFIVTGQPVRLPLTNGTATIVLRKGTYQAVSTDPSNQHAFIFEVPDDANTYYASLLEIKGLVAFAQGSVFTNSLGAVFPTKFSTNGNTLNIAWAGRAGTNIAFATNGGLLTIYGTNLLLIATGTNVLYTTNGNTVTINSLTDTNVVLLLATNTVAQEQFWRRSVALGGITNSVFPVTLGYVSTNNYGAQFTTDGNATFAGGAMKIRNVAGIATLEVDNAGLNTYTIYAPDLVSRIGNMTTPTNAQVAGYILLSRGGVASDTAWVTPTNIVTQNSHIVKQGTNSLLTTNGQVVTVNGLTDTNTVNILATNAAFLSVSNAFPEFSVSADGVANGRSTLHNAGRQFGPDTPGTTTSGIQEALNAAYQTNAYGPISGGAMIVLDRGFYPCTSSIIISNDFPFALWIRGAGKAASAVVYTGSGSNDFIVTSRITNGPDASLNLRMSGLGFYYLRDTNKCSVMRLKYINEAMIEDCHFGSYQSLRTTGAGMVYRANTPTNKLGIVGLRLEGNANNKMDFYHCSWFGLGVGVWTEADHNSFNDCFFGCIGTYSTNAVEGNISYVGSLWRPSDSPVGNLLTNGPAVFSDGFSDTVFDLNLFQCQFFTLNCAVLGNKNTITITSPVFENIRYTSLRDSAADVDLGRVVYLGQSPITTTDRLVLSDGTINGTNPTTGIFYGVPDYQNSSMFSVRYKDTNYFDLGTVGRATVKTLGGNATRYVQADSNGVLSAVIATNNLMNPWQTNANDLYFLRTENNVNIDNVSIGTNAPHARLEISSTDEAGDGIPQTLLLSTLHPDTTVGIALHDPGSTNNWSLYLSGDSFKVGKVSVADYWQIRPDGRGLLSTLAGTGTRLVEARSDGQLYAVLATNVFSNGRNITNLAGTNIDIVFPSGFNATTNQGTVTVNGGQSTNLGWFNFTNGIMRSNNMSAAPYANGGNVTNIAGTNLDIVWSTGMATTTNGHQLTVTSTGAGGGIPTLNGKGTNTTLYFDNFLGGTNNDGGVDFLSPTYIGNLLFGGEGNSIGNTPHDNVLLGGINNSIANGVGQSTIVGGTNNSIGSGSSQAAIIGGNGNHIGIFSPIGITAFIGAGSSNRIEGDYSAILGGERNLIDGYGDHNAILGGWFNRIKNASAVSFSNSVILGGWSNYVDASYALAAGKQSQASHRGSFAMSDAQNAINVTTISNQMKLRFQNGVTNDGPIASSSTNFCQTLLLDPFDVGFRRLDSSTVRFTGASDVLRSAQLDGILASGTINVTNGMASWLHNTAAPFDIFTNSAGSPFNWTNNTGKNLVVYLDANGATTSVTVNGQAVFASLASGDHTLLMKPLQRFTLTYSVATPLIRADEQ